MTEKREYAEFENAGPYFALVRRALGDLVEGHHFFDIVADNVIYEVRYELAGWPLSISGRAELMQQFQQYCKYIKLESADRLIIHKSEGSRAIVIEYEVRGTILATNVRYSNRFCSVMILANRRITRWRDYMDSLAAWNSLTAKAHS